MKKSFFLPFLLLFQLHNILAQTNGIEETVVKIKDIRNEAQLVDLPLNSKAVTFGYFDGLGRPLQTVSKQGSPSGYDIVVHIEYDNFGRENKKYLPYVSQEANGLFKEGAVNLQTGFYQSVSQYPNHRIANGVGYAVTVFEQSPLNRVIKQGAQGLDWQPDTNGPDISNDKTIKYSYETNKLNEVYLFKYDALTGTVSISSSSGAYYDVNQLFKNRTRNEHNNETIDYTDKEERIICRKVQYGVDVNSNRLYTSTYYVYDDFGNLVVVLPPEAINSAIDVLTDN